MRLLFKPTIHLKIAVSTAAPIFCLFSLLGCQKSDSTDHKSAESPAKVAKPVSEAQLNTIELTEAAVKRVGIQTEIASEQEAIHTRPYGADLLLPTDASVTVSAPLPGTVTGGELPDFPRVGRRVPKGQSLMKLLPLLSPERAVLTPAEKIRFAEAKNSLAQSRIDAEAAVQQSQVQVDAAKIALERAERLLKEKAGTVRAVDESRAQLELAEKALTGTQNRKRQVDSVKLDAEEGSLQPLVIQSPIAGMIRGLHVQPGEIIAAGAPLFDVMNDEVIWIKVPIYAGDLDDLDLRAPARITQLNKRYTDGDAQVKPIDAPPTSVPLTASVDAYYELPNENRLYQAGQKLTVQIRSRRDVKQLIIPWSAVIHDIYGGQWVYEETGKRQFARRRVEITSVDDGRATIRRGIQPGAKIVCAGAAELAGTEFGFAK